VHLSAEVAADVGDHHPYLRIIDDLVDRSGAIAKLIRGELDLAIVFDHDFAPTTAAPEGIRIQRLFDDPIRVLLPTTHPLARGPVIDVASLATDTWIRAIDGGAADLTEHVLSRHRLNPPILLAGHGDEPVEIQALVAAGRGVTLTHDLTVIVNRHDLAVLPIAEDAGVRHIDVAHADGPQTAATETVLKALRKIGARHQQRLHGRD
jgi:DNA-binding transcriptional LysR family regulator